jgi:hypothetical protein
MLYYIIPGTTSKKIDNELINDPNVKDVNELYYLYPEELYTRVLINKQDLKFEYKWLRMYTAILNELLVDLGKECICKKMTATSDLEFRCMVHPGKNGCECCPVDYCIHNLEMFKFF